jgi:tetratricopeptide (TPR) repeat protein
MWLGFAFLILLFVIIFLSSRSEKWRPVAFGFAWFLIASLPTSFFMALTQVSNSHRLFFPYVGLIIAFGWSIYQFILKIQPVFARRTFIGSIWAVSMITLFAYACGTYERNNVWRTEESLWYDISLKSPGNARALMNYGLAKMGKGEFFEAEYYYRKALKIWPNWPYLHINMGILANAQGKVAEAEQSFLLALQNGPGNPETYYYYAQFLNQHGRKQQAVANLQTAISLSAAHMDSRYLLMSIYAELGEWDLLRSLAQSTLQIVPNDPTSLSYVQMAEGKQSPIDAQQEALKKNPSPEGWLNLSLSYYQVGDYQKCIDACEEALKIKPDYADAYNNICSAYNAMGMWEKGAEACEKALQIKPDFELARNNLNWARKEMGKQ